MPSVSSSGSGGTAGSDFSGLAGGGMVFTQSMPAKGNAVPLGGPYNPVLDVLLCFLPVAFLLTVTLSKRLFLPTSRSLPLAAAMLWLIKMAWIGEDPIHITATVMQGALLALTPLLIMFGAFFFFNCLTITQTMPYMAALVRATCHGHPVAEVMLVLWGLGHLIEGASGFGTGPAMLPPIMAALGHPPFECIVCLLVMTTCVGPFGSSGIGLWFGLSALEWERAQLVRVTFLVAVCMTVMSLPACWLGARLLLTWQDVRGCWRFALASVVACSAPALVGSIFSFEAPGLLSGVVGVLATGWLARRRWGLCQHVPCMVARRLKELEAGATAAAEGGFLGDDAGHAAGAASLQTQNEGAGGAQPPLSSLQEEQAAKMQRQSGVIELTAVAASVASCPAASQLAQQQLSRSSLSHSQVRDQEEHHETAKSLLQALAAASPTSQAQPRSKTSAGAPAAIGICAQRHADDTEDEHEGSQGLLPAGAAHSDHNLAAYCTKHALPDKKKSSNFDSLQHHSTAAASIPHAQNMPASSSAAGVDCLRDRRQLMLRLLPWGAMLAVVAGTRVPYLQRSNGQELRLHLRSLGDFSISSNLVLQFRDLCRIGVNWSFALLYVPSLLPFVCTGCATLAAFRSSIPADMRWQAPFAAAATKCKSVAAAIIGALILVALMVQGGRQAPSYIIGYWLSEWLHRGYIAVSMPLGVIGAFFSGSIATSNLTFGLLQEVAAQKLGLNATAMVMLQIVGGAAGQAISISNILGGRAVMSLQHIPEGRFVLAALPVCLAYYAIGTALAIPFLFT